MGERKTKITPFALPDSVVGRVFVVDTRFLSLALLAVAKAGDDDDEDDGRPNFLR